MNVDLNYIIKRWENLNNTEDFQLYICNPFCINVCKFCAYKGIKYNKKDHDIYQNLYLKNLITSYSDIINERKIKSIFFGGGTPNLFDSKSLIDICKLIPNFKDIISKQFEIHPGHCTIDYIDLLGDLGFTSLLFGIQTFNEECLIEQDRIYSNFNHIKSLINKAKQKSIYTSIDIMCYINDTSQKELEQFERDLTLVKELEPDVICLQSNYKFNKFNFENKIYTNDEILLIETPFINIVKSNFNNSNYRWILEDKYDDILKKKIIAKNLRYVHKRISDEEFYSKVYGYFYDGLNAKRRTNTLALGSFGNQMVPTRSWICDELEYVEINNNWIPSYSIIYDNSKQKTYFELVLNELKNIEEPPLGFELTFKTFINLNREKNLSCTANWDKNNKTHINYIEKIKHQMN